MANLVILDEGKKDFLKLLADLAGGVKVDSLYVALFTDNHTIAHGDVIGSFTLCSVAGYIAQAITGLSAVTLDGSNRAQSAPTDVVFSNTSGSSVNVYGIVLVESNSGSPTTAYACGRFDGAPLTLPAGGTLKVPLNFTATSEFTS